MSNAHDKLVDFMRAKAKLLPKYKSLYFLKEDEKAIRSWPDAEADHILEHLRLRYKRSEGPHRYWGNSDSVSCVFCLKYMRGYCGPGCGQCTYGEIHGICGGGTSIYTRIMNSNIYIAKIVWEHKDELWKIIKPEDSST
jgi:hypothetical protein